MPVSKHRRRNQTRPREPDPAANSWQRNIMTIDDIRREIANPALDFPAKTILAGAWWFEQLLRRIGDRWQGNKASRKDKRTTALLLCVAMDGEHGQNDDLAADIANMLRPYCPASSFVEGWERAKQLSPGTVRAKVAEFLASTSKSTV